jgi:hypothetical protein
MHIRKRIQGLSVHGKTLSRFVPFSLLKVSGYRVIPILLAQKFPVFE